MKITPGANHAESDMRRQLAKLLRDEGLDVIDLDNKANSPDDDSPVSVSASASAGVCGTHLSVRQGVDRDDVNVLYFGARRMGVVVALNCKLGFFGDMFKRAGRYRLPLLK